MDAGAIMSAILGSILLVFMFKALQAVKQDTKRDREWQPRRRAR